MEFQGFTRETSDFLWELAFHNERPWFLEHKEQYLRVLKEPFDALGAALQEEMNKRHPEGEWNVHISRIYRDARRLYGRGPYKDHLWLTVWDGLPGEDNPAFWFEISAASYSSGVGFYDADASQMEAWRAYIRSDIGGMERLARRLNRQKEFSLSGEDYKRPKGDVGELLNPWYNKRWLGITAEHDFGGDALKPDFPRILADGFDFLMPYYRLFLRFKQSLK